jgi:predicted histone-like DNA-binding protein
MTVSYKVVAKKNPLDKAAPAKHYATLVSKGSFSLVDLAKRMEKITSLSRGDIISVLETFVDLIPEVLSEGNIVRLGNLGSVKITVRSEGSEKPEDVSGQNIKKVVLHFSAGKEVSDKLKTFTFKKAE